MKSYWSSKALFTSSLLHGYPFVITFVLLGAALVAQGQKPVFRSRVDLLQLDVTVLDRNGKPVRGLTKDDFLIVEDKKPQTIEAFTEVSIPDAPPPAAVWAHKVAPDVTTNEEESQRIFVVIVDDALGMGIDPATRLPDLWAVREMKKTVAAFIESLSPVDAVSLVYTNNTRESQNLTHDHARLVRAIGDYPEDGGGILTPMKGAAMDPCLGRKYVVGTFEAVVKHLASIPDRRKAVVYFGGLLPFPADACLLKPWWDQTLEAAQQAHVTINPIYTMGFRGGIPDSYLSLAGETGGHAVVGSNDFMPGLKQIFLENSSYYLMAYAPTNEVEDGTFRRLSVTVRDRPDLEVRTRRSYWAPKRKAGEAEPPPPPPNVEALAGILPVSKLALRVTAAPFARAGADGAQVAIALGLRQPAFGERTPEQVDVLIKAFTADGDERGSDAQTIPVTVPAAKLGAETSRYEVLARIDLPKPGHYELRLSAHSGVTDTRGSVFVDFEVPDFRKAAVSFSGVVLNNALASDPIAPPRLLRDLVPLTPTSQRTFASVDIITGLVRVYQGGNGSLANIALKTTIVDAANKPVFAHTDNLAADRFAAGRATDHQFRLPLAGMKPGMYLLTLETTVGKVTARRDVVFQVR